MTTRTWTGGTTNSAADPNAWTPAGAPAPGDTLNMNSGTMNVSGTALAGDPVGLQGNGSSATFNLSGESAGLSADLQGYGQNVTINLADGTDWVGGLAMYPQSDVTVNGAGARWSNTKTFVNGSAKIAPAVDGTGSITVDEAHSAGVLEFMAGVGPGQSVSITGYAYYGGQHGVVRVDQPAGYQAPTTLGFGEIHLEGLHADSYAQSGGTLTLYEQGDVVDTLNLTLATVNGFGPQGFGVSQTADAVVIHADGTYYKDGGTALPVYTPQPPQQPPPAGGGADSGTAVETNTSTVVATATASTPPVSHTAVASNTAVASSSSAPSASASASSSSTSNSIVMANGGSTPIPLSQSEAGVVSAAAGLSPSAGGAMSFFFDGAHVGHDFDALGSAISSGQDQTAATNQCVTDLKQLLSAYVASAPSLGSGVGVPGGPQLAIPGQFVVDVINTSLKALAIGDAGLDHAYAGCLSQFFGAEASVMMGAAH